MILSKKMKKEEFEFKVFDDAYSGIIEEFKSEIEPYMDSTPYSLTTNYSLMERRQFTREDLEVILKEVETDVYMWAGTHTRFVIKAQLGRILEVNSEAGREFRYYYPAENTSWDECSLKFLDILPRGVTATVKTVRERVLASAATDFRDYERFTAAETSSTAFVCFTNIKFLAVYIDDQAWFSNKHFYHFLLN